MALVILTITIAYVGLIIAFTIGFGRVLSVSSPIAPSQRHISVVIAFKDEELNLSCLLESMIHQSYPKDRFEVILVNDHSFDSSNSVVERYCSTYSNFKLINLPGNKTGKKAAITLGIDSASYPLIALTDADCIPSPDWLRDIVGESENGSTLILGPVTMSPINTLAEKFQALDYASLMASAAGSSGVGMPVIASSANLAFRNDLLQINVDKLVPEVSSGDDMFLLHHAKRLKHKIAFLGRRSAVVKTATVSSISKAIEQRVRWSSKSTCYTDRDTIVTGFIVLLFSLVMIATLLASLVRLEFLYLYLVLFIVKSTVDFILLIRYLNVVEQRELLKVFLPLQLLYPFYICYSFFLGIFNRTSWKGRPIS